MEREQRWTAGEVKKERATGRKAGRQQPPPTHGMSVWLLIVLSGWLTRAPHATGPGPSVDNAVSYSSLLCLIKNRQIDVTAMVELCLTLTGSARAHIRAHPSTHTCTLVRHTGQPFREEGKGSRII